MKTRLFLSVLALLLLPMLLQATHIKSGHISYTMDPQNPRKFNFTLTLYTNHYSQAEDPDVNMRMGDGNIVVVPRTSVKKYNRNYDKETFLWSYTYPVPGTYTVDWIGPNRDNGLINLPAPSDVNSFYVYTTVKADPVSPNRHGAHLAGLPLMEGFVGEKLTHNLAAYDADGDQLIYQLVTPKKEDPAGNIVAIAGYEIPEGLTINKYGELNWDAPAVAGRYIVAIQIIEYRDGVVQGLSVVDFMVVVQPKDKDKSPGIELLNKSRLTLNDDGSVKAMPGQPLKLEYFMRRHPDSNDPIRARLYSELDTLELLPINMAVRDSADGQAITVSFTPGEDLERDQAYTLAMSVMSLEQVPFDFRDDRYIDTGWDFTYVYVGEQQPTSSDEELRKAGFILYPNPIADRFVVEAPDMPGMFMHLFDANGKRAGALQLQPGKNHFTKPRYLSTGLYFYTIYSRFKPVGSGKVMVR